MPTRPNRETVNLSQYPDLVVIYLGMRVNTVTGIKTLLGFGPKISASFEARPDGLLLHESVFYSLRHVGMRQYWRDFESLRQWSRSAPHRTWHQTYLRRGGVEAVYVDMEKRTGMAAFAPLEPARGAMFSARKRAGVSGSS